MGVPSRLRRQVVAAVVDTFPEPTLRSMQRLRHGEPRRGKTVRSAPRGVTAHPLPAFDARAQRAETAQAVAGVLEAATLPYVRLPGGHGTARQLAVPAELRDEVAAALRAALPPWGGWVLSPAGSGRMRVHRELVAPDGTWLAGAELGCELGFWPVGGGGRTRPHDLAAEAGTRLAPAPTGVVDQLPPAMWERAAAAPTHWIDDPPWPDVFEVRDPVDVVYTWVDGDDPDWRRRRADWAGPQAGTLNATAASAARFVSRDELRYSLRSVAMYASWVRRIHIVTDGQVPGWLDTSHPAVRVVDHRDVFRDPQVLPVFNSHAIESQLHHVPGLSERYLYCNDDFFFGCPVEPELFFHANGLAKFFLAASGVIDLGPPSARDLPVVSAAKNQRALLERDAGVTVHRRFRHVAQPQLRTVLDELEHRYPELFERVAASRFRHPDDFSIASGLHHYYAYVQGRAVPADIRYRYQDLARPDTARRLDEILRERPQMFCLNDVDSRPDQHAAQQATLAEFFAAYYPVPAPWERAGS